VPTVLCSLSPSPSPSLASVWLSVSVCVSARSVSRLFGVLNLCLPPPPLLQCVCARVCVVFCPGVSVTDWPAPYTDICLWGVAVTHCRSHSSLSLYFSFLFS
jgi:hypothetical protein